MAFPVAAPLFGGLLGGIGILIGGKGLINLNRNYKNFKAFQKEGNLKETGTVLDEVKWKDPLTKAKGNSNNNKIISVDEFIENGPPVRKR